MKWEALTERLGKRSFVNKREDIFPIKDDIKQTDIKTTGFVLKHPFKPHLI